LTLCLFDLDRALLIIRFTRDRTVGVDAEFIDHLGLVEEGYKDIALFGFAESAAPAAAPASKPEPEKVQQDDVDSLLSSLGF